MASAAALPISVSCLFQSPSHGRSFCCDPTKQTSVPLCNHQQTSGVFLKHTSTRNCTLQRNWKTLLPASARSRSNAFSGVIHVSGTLLSLAMPAITASKMEAPPDSCRDVKSLSPASCPIRPKRELSHGALLVRNSLVRRRSRALASGTCAMAPACLRWRRWDVSPQNMM